jgi:hypothetical protein
MEGVGSRRGGSDGDNGSAKTVGCGGSGGAHVSRACGWYGGPRGVGGLCGTGGFLEVENEVGHDDKDAEDSGNAGKLEEAS